MRNKKTKIKNFLKSIDEYLLIAIFVILMGYCVWSFLSAIAKCMIDDFNNHNTINTIENETIDNIIIIYNEKKYRLIEIK